MLSTMDLVELDVLRMMSAPPTAERLFPSRTISSAPSSRIILSLSGECEIAMVSKPAAFAYCTARCQSPPIPSTAPSSAGCAPARGQGFEEIVREGVQAFGAHRCSRCRLPASSPALDLLPVEAAEHL